VEVSAQCRSSSTSIGHTAFLEAPERFNRELAALTRRVAA
jgi:hypothetical protein